MRSPRSPLTATTALLCVGALGACTMGHDATRSSSGASAPSATSASQPASGSPASSSASPSVAMTAKQVWSQAQKRIGGYTSLVVDGYDAADGTGPHGVFSGELDGDPSQMTYQGTKIGNATMRRLSGTVYLKGDKAYWDAISKHGSHKNTSKLVNQWIETPASALSSQDLDDISAKRYVDSLADTSDPKWGTIAAPGAVMTQEDVAGTPTYKIVSDDGDTTVWVTRDGTYDLVKVVDEQAGPHDLGTATFSRWNDRFTFDKPTDTLRSNGGTSGRATT